MDGTFSLLCVMIIGEILLSFDILFCLARKNYVVERVEIWNGHVYTTKNEQPFYRVYHEPHKKVVRDGPMAGKLSPEQMSLAREQITNWQTRMSEIISPSYPHQQVVKIKPIKPHYVAPEGIEVFIRQRTNSNRRKGVFGHHHLPEGEVKDSAKWPWEIWPYLSCMTLECQCPLFRGKIVGFECILPSGKPLKKAIRKEIRSLTKSELRQFVVTMRKFRDSGLYNQMGLVHRRSGVHSGPSFLTWHREYLKRLEMVYRSFFSPDDDATLGLPYWDSTLDGDLPKPNESIMFSDYLLGEVDDEGGVISGLFANWTTMDGRPTYTRLFGLEPDGEMFSEGRIDWIMEQTEVDQILAYTLPLQTCLNYTTDERFLEYSHDYVHYFVAGDMLERFSSSNDPLFFMHHGMIDLIWEQWRQTKQTRAQRERDYPRDDGECMPEWHFSYAYMPMLQPMRNIDALSNKYTDLLHEYAPRLRCRGGSSSECGNIDFLFCNAHSDPENPICCAKIRPFGDCRGYEWSDEVCYRGQCIKGRCTAAAEGPTYDTPKSPELQQKIELDILGLDGSNQKQNVLNNVDPSELNYNKLVKPDFTVTSRHQFM